MGESRAYTGVYIYNGLIQLEFYELKGNTNNATKVNLLRFIKYAHADYNFFWL